MALNKHDKQRGQVSPGGFNRPWTSTYIGVLLALIALIIAIIVAIGDAGWTKNTISLEFVLVALAILL